MAEGREQKADAGSVGATFSRDSLQLQEGRRQMPDLQERLLVAIPCSCRKAEGGCRIRRSDF